LHNQEIGQRNGGWGIHMGEMAGENRMGKASNTVNPPISWGLGSWKMP